MAKPQPPHNTEAEEALLGALLLDLGALEKVKPLLQPEDFFIVRYGWVFEAMLALSEREEPGEYIAVCDELERAGRLDEVGGPSGVSGLVSGIFDTGHVQHYARIMSRTAQRRRAIQAARDLAASAYREDRPLETIFKEHQQRMEALAAGCAPRQSGTDKPIVPSPTSAVQAGAKVSPSRNVNVPAKTKFNRPSRAPLSASTIGPRARTLSSSV